ncbi:hypothetical protein [Streptomyces viridosporus]|uniref:hypothetical protein n=1 Tax=Streptomyces viridosporus TaxID=67581 RepID=UPI0009C0F820|nr:hypothetical protein [Streptomyces viridosporus]
MEESNAKPQPKHPFRRSGRRTQTIGHLRAWMSRQGRNLPGQFLQGAAYRLGGGAVTLIILWWQTRY